MGLDIFSIFAVIMTKLLCHRRETQIVYILNEVSMINFVITELLITVC